MKRFFQQKIKKRKSKKSLKALLSLLLSFLLVFSISIVMLNRYSFSDNITPDPGTLVVNGINGLSYTISPSTILMRTVATSPGFTMNITDTDLTYSDYQLSGLPVGTTLVVGTTTITSNGTDFDGNATFTITGTEALQPIKIFTPIGYSGSIAHMTLSRLTPGNNIMTDFDNGTFNYIGTAAPQLPTAAHSGYIYVTNTSANYLAGGEYTIGMTGACHTSAWRDVRSRTNPLSTSTVPFLFPGGYPGIPISLADNNATNQANSGKFLMFNATRSVLEPYNFLSFDMDVTPYTSYEVSAFVADLLTKTYFSNTPGVVPASIALVVTLQDGTEVLIGGSENIHANFVDSDPATMSDWTQFAKTINVGNNTKITLSFRDNIPMQLKEDGSPLWATDGTNSYNGDDVAIDDITVRPYSYAAMSATQELLVNPLPTISGTLKNLPETNSDNTPFDPTGLLIHYSYTDPETSTEIDDTVSVDADGNYSIPDVPPGVVVTVTPPDVASRDLIATPDQTGTPGTVSGNKYNITMGLEDSTGNDFTYPLKVTYDANLPNPTTSGSVPVDSKDYLPTDSATVMGNPNNLTSKGYILIGWSLTKKGSAVTTVSMASGDVTLYAIWDLFIPPDAGVVMDSPSSSLWLFILSFLAFSSYLTFIILKNKRKKHKPYTIIIR